MDRLDIPGSKSCSVCGLTKALEEFQPQPQGRYGRRADCRSCTSERRKIHYRKNPNRRREADSAWYLKNKERKALAGARWRKVNRDKVLAAKNKWKKANPDKVKIHTLVRRAIERGILVPAPCESCGSVNRVVAHHDDYARPLEVRWLCHRCHMAHHAVEPKAANGVSV